jgi:Ni,Fe-hydrogenase III large subunit
LYWLTRGLGNLSQPAADAAGVSGPAARANGDVPARYRQWLTAVLDDIARLEETAPLDPAGREGPRGRLDGPRPPSAALADVLPHLLEGVEVAAARLIVASLDPDPDELAARLAEVAHG